MDVQEVPEWTIEPQGTGSLYEDVSQSPMFVTSRNTAHMH